MTFKRGDIIPADMNIPAREIATLTKPDRFGIGEYTDRVSTANPKYYIVFEAKEKW